MSIMDDMSLQQMISTYLEHMAHVSVVELFVEFEQIPYVVGAVEEVQPDLAIEGYYSDSEEEFEGTFEIDDANEKDVPEHDMESDVEDVANALANELPFQEPSFMRVLDEEAMKEPEFAEDMNIILAIIMTMMNIISVVVIKLSFIYDTRSNFFSGRRVCHWDGI
ncbi:hypothetical protein PIB30_013781 [Stylosanthes scabra]|uniref:Uncharacterized protein n=1 Tax=Stylosanthes scabra TaxID=79078 RepID=A0ABU6Q6F1_9FABA|nr:hypothetical protein [Stylosanthes scabra]